jgi:cytochrome bd-type quinol oxidase subunit 2
MQHPVGYAIDHASHQAVMTDFWAVVTNPTFFAAYFHVLFGAFLTAAVFMLAVAACHMRRGNDTAVFAKVARIAIVATVLSGVGTIFLGDTQAEQMEQQQPMKMAAAEALYDTTHGASFSLLTIGDLNGNPTFRVACPTCSACWRRTRGTVRSRAFTSSKPRATKKYGAGSYVPVIWVECWTFRIMVGLGFLLLFLGGYGLWLMYRGRLEKSSRFLRFASWMLLAPFLANTTGWIFTEVGRQPWVVYGLLKTSDAVTVIAPGYVATSLIGFTAIYSFLAVIEIGLMIKVATKAPAALATSADTLTPSSSTRSMPVLRPTLLSSHTSPSGLQQFWFILIGVLWVGYFFLEGFDFGVGTLLPFLTKDDDDRRVLINTVGPVSDGNEVWLLTAGGATFAAFPLWYATVFSGFYLALFLVLAALIFRGMAFEFRSKREDLRWRRWWDRAIFWGSALPALLWGVAFADFVAGVPIGANATWTGTFFDLVKPYALLGGLTTLSLFTLHGATFLGLKSDGVIRERAQVAATRLAPITFAITGGLSHLDVPHRPPPSRRRPRSAAAAVGRSGHPRQRDLVGAREARRLGLPRHRAQHRRRRRHVAAQPLPPRSGFFRRSSLLAHDRPDGLAPLHVESDDHRRVDLHALRSRLPGVDLLGLSFTGTSQRREGDACHPRRLRVPPPREPVEPAPGSLGPLTRGATGRCRRRGERCGQRGSDRSPGRSPGRPDFGRDPRSAAESQRARRSRGQCRPARRRRRRRCARQHRRGRAGAHRTSPPTLGVAPCVMAKSPPPASPS